MEEIQPIPQQKKFFFNNKFSLGVVVILVVSLSATVILSQQKQENRSRASVTAYRSITFQGKTTTTPTVQKSYEVLTTPANILSGDLLIAHLSVYSPSTLTITAPSGWKLIRKDVNATRVSALYYRVATGSEAATYRWNFSITTAAIGGIAAYRNVDPASPIDASSGQAGSGGILTAPSVNTTTPADTLLFFAATLGDAYVASGSTMEVVPPSGMTLRWQASTANYASSHLSDQVLTASGPTGNRIANSNLPSTKHPLAQLVALKPIGYVVADTPMPTLAATAAPMLTRIPTELPTWMPAPTGTEDPTSDETSDSTDFPIPTDVFPTNISKPTDVPEAGSTVLTMRLALHGIGNGGDSTNPQAQGNLLPLNPQRPISVEVYNMQNQLLITKPGLVNYDRASGLFTGLVDLGTAFPEGSYVVKVKLAQYIRAVVPGVPEIRRRSQNELPITFFIVGDINGDDQISIQDYSSLIGCYSDLSAANDCNAVTAKTADLTDDGRVNQFDYNLFLRELVSSQGR